MDDDMVWSDENSTYLYALQFEKPSDNLNWNIAFLLPYDRVLIIYYRDKEPHAKLLFQRK